MFDPSMIVWIDETGCELHNALREYDQRATSSLVPSLPPNFSMLHAEKWGKTYHVNDVLRTREVN